MTTMHMTNIVRVIKKMTDHIFVLALVNCMTFLGYYCSTIPPYCEVCQSCRAKRIVALIRPLKLLHRVHF